MKRAHILHNPKAGSQDQSKTDILNLITGHGYECGYSSTKDVKWKNVDRETDFLVVAGGDGTVRKVALQLLRKDRFKKKLPILLLPKGTANNISRSIDIAGDDEGIVEMLKAKKVKKYDVGVVEGWKKERIFLESLGYGLFPELMKRMKKIPEREDATPEENILTALQELHKLVLSYNARSYSISVEGRKYTEKYLMVEVMNISSIGPRLNLSPDSDPGDGEFELVLVPENQRQELADYVAKRIEGVESNFSPINVKTREVSITTDETLLHTDDELIRLKEPKKIKIRPEWGMMEFFVR